MPPSRIPTPEGRDGLKPTVQPVPPGGTGGTVGLRQQDKSKPPTGGGGRSLSFVNVFQIAPRLQANRSRHRPPTTRHRPPATGNRQLATGRRPLGQLPYVVPACPDPGRRAVSSCSQPAITVTEKSTPPQGIRQQPRVFPRDQIANQTSKIQAHPHSSHSRCFSTAPAIRSRAASSRLCSISTVSWSSAPSSLSAYFCAIVFCSGREKRL